MTPRNDIGDLIDLDRYPLADPGGDSYEYAVAEARMALQQDGCAIVRDMLRPEAVRRLSEEIRLRKAATHFSVDRINAYFHTEFNADYPGHHPVNTFVERSSGFIPGDAWETDCAMARLFGAPDLARFLTACLGISALYCYTDPLAGLTANILDPGQQFAWHFDTNEFAVTVLVDEAADGGLFEYVPGIRTADDENFPAIQAVLDGGRDGVVTLDLRPGDPQIFRGRHSLHRVTRVGETSTPRHSAILAYTEKPGVIGRLARTRQLFGRVLQEHVDAERARIRSDELLD